MALLTVDQILTAQDVAEEIVSVPEWGGEVKVRAFTKAKQQEVRRAATVTVIKNGKPVEEIDVNKLELLSFVAGVVEPQFSPDDVAKLAEKAAGPIDRVAKRVMVLSGLAPEAVKEAEKSDSAQS